LTRQEKQGDIAPGDVNHADLFGLRQVMAARAGRPCESPSFVLRGLYRVVRHPLMLGFLVVFWAAPTMTVGRAPPRKAG
jgi:hypothetical protein